MKLTANELEYLSAWAKEEKASDPYVLPAHQLQARFQIRSVQLIRAIKAWARAEGNRDEDIFQLPGTTNAPSPWNSAEHARERLEEILSAYEAPMA